MNNIFFNRSEMDGNEDNVDNILSKPVEDVHSHVTIEIWMSEPNIPNIPNIPIG